MCKKITAVEKTDSCAILVHTDCGTDSYRLIGWTNTSIKLSNDSGIKEIFWNQVDDPNFFNASDWVDNFKSCISFSEDEDNKVDNSYLTLCKDRIKVIFEVCKDSLGNKTYEGSDGSNFTSFADIIADGFTVECEEQKISDLKQLNAFISTGGTEETLIPELSGYDAMKVWNCSTCPVLAKVTIDDGNGVTIDRNFWLSGGETEVFDWECDVIKQIQVGATILPTTGAIDSDNLTFSPALEDTKIRVTFFNS